jgi:hypothetical protein
MSENIHFDSTYRFIDPIRFFKANDPYYFEVDNIPLKQLQQNCLWLKDQLRRDADKIRNVKRGDLDELRPYANGADRVVRVKPGRYTARINDATSKAPLAYLLKVMGDTLGDVDAWQTATPNAGNFPGGANALLSAALEQFKSTLSQDALGMTGLVERAFTWPVVNIDTPVDGDGAVVVNSTDGALSYGSPSLNTLGGGAHNVPFVISQALVWAKALNSGSDAYVLPTYETTNPNSGFAKFPRTESYFIKKWRGVSRLAIVDVDDELNIEVPAFDPSDFEYINAQGQATPVEGVQSRIDLVFIYSKPVDASGVTILKSTGKRVITKPQLGIIRGAGIKANFQPTADIQRSYMQNTGEDHKILASPGDQSNTNMGFTAASGNDITFDVRGSFPAPDDILNLAPLISEKLESEAYELIGQSILPVAYVWVQQSTNVVLSSDVIDIRPLFRTAELAYNERAGISAAFPQLSLANPAVGKAQLDLEIKKIYEELLRAGSTTNNTYVTEGGGDTGTPQDSMNVLATGYVFGGWNFGPEGALFDYYQSVFGQDDDDTNDSVQVIKQYIIGKYGFGSNAAQISIPSYPDWDLSQWCTEQDITSKGSYPNDYINTFFGTNGSNDPTIVAGSYSQLVNDDGTTEGGGTPARLQNFRNAETGDMAQSRVGFHYIAKKIKFNRSSTPWLADYKVSIDLINCLPQNSQGFQSGGGTQAQGGSYFGHWVEKGFDEFTIYVAFIADDLNSRSGTESPRFPAPHSLTFTSGGKKKKTTNTLNVSERGGERFSGFVVPVSDLLYSNTNPVSSDLGLGYVGNPRVGKCTYPTVMWSLQGVPQSDIPYLYGNLNGTNPTIALKPN